MDKKNYQTPAAEVVRLQPTHMIAESSPTQGGESGGGNSRAFYGSVDENEDEPAPLGE